MGGFGNGRRRQKASPSTLTFLATLILGQKTTSHSDVRCINPRFGDLSAFIGVAREHVGLHRRSGFSCGWRIESTSSLSAIFAGLG